MENCSQVTVHQIFLFFQGYDKPNFVAPSSHGGLQFIKYHIEHSHLLFMFCYPGRVDIMQCLRCLYFYELAFSQNLNTCICRVYYAPNLEKAGQVDCFWVVRLFIMLSILSRMVRDRILKFYSLNMDGK